MTRQIPSSMVTVTFSTRRAILPAGIVHRVATLAGADGLDVDATTAPGRWLAARLAASHPAGLVVRSLWVPAGEYQSSTNRRLIENLAYRQSDTPLFVVVVLPTATTFHELTAQLALSGSPVHSVPVVLGL